MIFSAMNATPAALTSKAWLAYLVTGLLLVVGYFLVPEEGTGILVRLVLYCLTTASAAVAMLYGVRRNRPKPALPWILLALSQIVYASADATFYITHYVFKNTDFPSAADPLYLSHYPLVVVGLALLIRRRTPGRDVAGILDAAVLVVVAGMLSWLYLIAPRARFDSPILTKIVSLAFPMMDLAMFVVALRLIMGGGRRPASFFLLITNLFGIMTADTLYVLQLLSGSYSAGNFLDAIWLAANLALGAAALHPTMTELSQRSRPRERGVGPARIVSLSAAVLVAPVTLMVQHARGESRDIPVIAVVCGVLFVLTIARMALLVADQRRLAITDGLTGSHTRRFFEAQLSLEVTRARRYGTTLAVLIIDVDHFKSINDRFGHPVGDRALIEIAVRLRHTARAGDVLARYGGEEFALLLPEVSAEDSRGIAERLRTCIASSPVTASGGIGVGVTVSIGVAGYPAHGQEPDKLVAVADRALYAAKAQGRDRVVVGEASAWAFNAICTAGEHTAVIDYLNDIADKVDGNLAGQEHSRAIGRWARLLSVESGHDHATARHTELAGRLHDIGKVVVPEAILTKPAKLNEDEWRVMRQHPDHGYRLARMVPGFAVVAEIIRQHHERYDGQGYPDGLAGNDIRIEARIIAVCDSWAAMRADRPYQSALSEEAARDELLRGRGTQYDPDVVDLFLDLQQKGQLGELRPIDYVSEEDGPGTDGVAPAAVDADEEIVESVGEVAPAPR
jgi:two-component system cell cycle response regulator